MDASKKEVIEDTLVDVKFSGIQWENEEGFFYSSYDNSKSSELSEITNQHKLYFHKLGMSQSEDIIIYVETPEENHRYVGS